MEQAPANQSSPEEPPHPEHRNGVQTSESGGRTPHRRRAKRACEPCKNRKKRCDGYEPCQACVTYEYKCIYSDRPRKNAAKKKHRLSPGIPESHQMNPFSGVPHTPESVTSPASAVVGESARRSVAQRDYPNHIPIPTDPASSSIENMEANSGSAFTRLLASKLDPSQGSKRQYPAWNLGIKSQVALPVHFTSFLSISDMQSLSNVYFEKFHVSFGFLNREIIERRMLERWERNDLYSTLDPMFAGIAALGSLFSGTRKHLREDAFVDYAKKSLEETSTPTWDHVGAWLLRTWYLRCTTNPHLTWIASCTAMHTMEAVLDPWATNEDQPEGYARNAVFWLARLVNTWISNEYGRSRVALHMEFPPSPDSTTVPGSYVHELLFLFKISELQDPELAATPNDFDQGIHQIASLQPHTDAIILSQSNLALALYRRLRILRNCIPQNTIKTIISLGRAGLRATERLAELAQPWWHVANVPFQVSCVLLMIDTRESVTHVPEALRTLQVVENRYPFQSVGDAVVAVKILIQLAQRKKEEDVADLRRCLTLPPSRVQTPRMGGTPAYDAVRGTGGAMGSGVSAVGNGMGGGMQVVLPAQDWKDLDWQNDFNLGADLLGDVDWDGLISMFGDGSNGQGPLAANAFGT